jgi:hypothetical protein
MGLWGSKQKRDINLENPSQTPGQVFLSEDAITNILKTAQDNNVSNNSTKLNDKRKSPPSNDSNSSDLKLIPDLHDKRIQEYEKQMVTSLENASKYVENMFRDRYKTIPVCNDLQKSVSKCYSDNSNQTLKCLDIANQFIKCVEDERQSRLAGGFNRNSSPKLSNA